MIAPALEHSTSPTPLEGQHSAKKGRSDSKPLVVNDGDAMETDGILLPDARLPGDRSDESVVVTDNGKGGRLVDPNRSGLGVNQPEVLAEESKELFGPWMVVETRQCHPAQRSFNETLVPSKPGSVGSLFAVLDVLVEEGEAAAVAKPPLPRIQTVGARKGFDISAVVPGQKSSTNNATYMASNPDK
ncbi:hypothetical protein V6N13_009273 [Hibiscus sabdariffa]|uniref:Uncharacterized protein n=2 Tax=Hibiscus sabdariffa TaxID=183260 RepID=A0ABR1ZLU2_9ROSI